MTPPAKDKPPRTRKQSSASSTNGDGAGGGAGSAPPGGAAPPRAPDTPPDTSRQRRRPTTRAGRRSKATITGEIADGLAQLLQMPAVPCAVLGDQWAAEHFTNQGRELADAIAGVSERNEVLRQWCERMLEGETVAVLLMASIMYVAPPAIHWGILPAPPGFMGIPTPPARRGAIVPEPPVEAPELDVGAHFPDGEPPAEFVT